MLIFHPKLEVFTVMKIHVVVLRVVTSCKDNLKSMRDINMLVYLFLFNYTVHLYNFL